MQAVAPFSIVAKLYRQLMPKIENQLAPSPCRERSYQISSLVTFAVGDVWLFRWWHLQMNWLSIFILYCCIILPIDFALLKIIVYYLFRLIQYRLELHDSKKHPQNDGIHGLATNHCRWPYWTGYCWHSIHSCDP